jgi:hypothetical protein
MKYSGALTAMSVALLLAGCGSEADSTQARGPDPKLPEAQRGLLPSMKIAEPVAWGDRKPLTRSLPTWPFHARHWSCPTVTF